MPCPFIRIAGTSPSPSPVARDPAGATRNMTPSNQVTRTAMGLDASPNNDQDHAGPPRGKNQILKPMNAAIRSTLTSAPVSSPGLWLCLSLACVSPILCRAQTASAKDTKTAADQTVTLEQFTVTTDADRGYSSKNMFSSAARISTSLLDT